MGKNIHPVYFTCANHFEEMVVSLQAMIAMFSVSGISSTTYVYEDSFDPMDAGQKDRLASIGDIILRRTDKSMSWGGVNTLENEMIGFHEISKEIDPDDYIMNIDSDAIMVSPSILRKVLNSDADVIGHPIGLVFHASWDHQLEGKPAVFQQGSCYFLKASFVPKMLVAYGRNRTAILKETCETCYTPLNAIPPDVAFSNIAKAAGGKIEYHNFMADQGVSVIHLQLTRDSFWRPFGEVMGIRKFGKHEVVKAVSTNK